MSVAHKASIPRAAVPVERGDRDAALENVILVVATPLAAVR
jgi:hypothetical protein